MRITYLYHSGFLAETKHTAMLFDYYTEHGKYDTIVRQDLGEKPFLIFVSHAHADHFDTAICKWEKEAHYIVAEGVQFPEDFSGTVTVMKPHETIEIGNATVRTLASNDEGVAFLVHVDNNVIFHAGDLNWWHWNGESDTFNKDIEQSYCREIDLLKGETIDAAFIPADPRLEDKYDWAVEYFMNTIDTKVLFPMHFWKKFEICEQLRQKSYGGRVAHIRNEGDTFSV